MELGGARFHHATQNYELFIYEVLHLIFSDLSCPQATDTTESEAIDRRDYCNLLISKSESCEYLEEGLSSHKVPSIHLSVIMKVCDLHFFKKQL